MRPTISVIWDPGFEGSAVATKGSVVVAVVSVTVLVDFVVFLLVVGVDVVFVDDLVDVDVVVDDVVDDVDVDVSNLHPGVKVTSSIPMLPR